MTSYLYRINSLFGLAPSLALGLQLAKLSKSVPTDLSCDFTCMDASKEREQDAISFTCIDAS